MVRKISNIKIPPSTTKGALAFLLPPPTSWGRTNGAIPASSCRSLRILVDALVGWLGILEWWLVGIGWECWLVLISGMLIIFTSGGYFFKKELPNGGLLFERGDPQFNVWVFLLVILVKDKILGGWIFRDTEWNSTLGWFKSVMDGIQKIGSEPSKNRRKHNDTFGHWTYLRFFNVQDWEVSDTYGNCRIQKVV